MPLDRYRLGQSLGMYLEMVSCDRLQNVPPLPFPKH